MFTENSIAMSYTPSEADEGINHPSYSIFNYEGEKEELTLLNFSRYSQRSFFPAYTAERAF
jgi:hypothetical protein